jgi:hypothetical protein
MGRRHAQESPGSASITAAPALDITLPLVMTGFTEDRCQDGPVRHERQVGPGALVVNGYVPFKNVHLLVLSIACTQIYSLGSHARRSAGHHTAPACVYTHSQFFLDPAPGGRGSLIGFMPSVGLCWRLRPFRIGTRVGAESCGGDV